jgi:hypothetical protein
MAKYLILNGISCDVIKVLSLNLLSETEKNYDFLRNASIPAHNQNWYLPNMAGNMYMYVYTRLLDWSTWENVFCIIIIIIICRIVLQFW